MIDKRKPIEESVIIFDDEPSQRATQKSKSTSNQTHLYL